MHDWIFRKLISDYEDVKNPAVRDQYGKVAGVVGILSNTLLCVMKILVGLLSGSIAIVADAVNNLADASSSLITLIGFKLAAMPEDKEHPAPDKFYGFVFQDSDFSKWIEAVAYSLTNHPDEKLEQIADEAIEIVCAAQAENGYLDTYYIINGMDRIFTTGLLSENAPVSFFRLVLVS
mgnify:CR=1 FL=1